MSLLCPRLVPLAHRFSSNSQYPAMTSASSAGCELTKANTGRLALFKSFSLKGVPWNSLLEFFRQFSIASKRYSSFSNRMWTADHLAAPELLEQLAGIPTWISVQRQALRER